MKTFIVIFACFLLANAAYIKKTEEDSIRFNNECEQSLKIPKELRAKYDKDELPDDELTHKFIKCIALKFETWNEKDGYVPELLAAQFGQNKKASIEKCLTKRNPDWTTEKWAWNNWKCLSANGVPRV
ncbi:uncharacterized protein LOC129614552 [Condylostylus longicornis]|uniref:uncharacterized protein LOC129614552 n=1 Tax=Condylostylus longicornis TaxID=2530218 RepID=UPI00244E05D9|nr:uncharacterized protein LOC129614552 [Condylostylus longicornis]